jgi:hypothetical protein
VDDLGSFVNGMPTIYLKVASYRDELCHLTIADAFEKAKHPDRIFVGIVEQNALGDVPCLQVCQNTSQSIKHTARACRWKGKVSSHATAVQ